MMTPQEVANCTFAKAAIGGYHMTSVDEFLDKLTEDYSALYKENAALKAKLKVMVDKMAEYREMEDAMRSTLLTAQKMATTMVAEAEQKRNAMIASASADAQARRNELSKEIDREERRLLEVRQRVDRELEAEKKRLAFGQVKLREFIRDVKKICGEELNLLERLPNLPAEEVSLPVQEAPAVPPQQAASESTRVLEAEPAAEQQSEPPPAAPAAAPTLPVPMPEIPVPAVSPEVFTPPVEVSLPPDQPPPGDPFADDGPSDSGDTEPTRIVNLENLQFGRNYGRG